MCPACKKPMIALELEGIEIDHCLDCGGTWLDGGEIEAISERAGGDPGKLARFLEVMEPFGVVELVKSGRVAIARESTRAAARAAG